MCLHLQQKRLRSVAHYFAVHIIFQALRKSGFLTLKSRSRPTSPPLCCISPKTLLPPLDPSLTNLIQFYFKTLLIKIKDKSFRSFSYIFFSGSQNTKYSEQEGCLRSKIYPLDHLARAAASDFESTQSSFGRHRSSCPPPSCWACNPPFFFFFAASPP